MVPNFVFLVVLFGIWNLDSRVPARRRNVLATDLVLVVFLLLLLDSVCVRAQYAAVALKRPLVDGWLAAADAAIGVHVPSLTAWTRAHSWVASLLTICYGSLIPQFVLAPIVAAFALRDRSRLWEYAFHYHFCLIVTLAALAIFPAACAFTHYGFESTLNQSRFIHQFQALRDGSLMRVEELEGLISMPSFHTAGALMVTWMFRGYRVWLVPVALLNAGLIASTVMTGAHYVIDVVATCGLFVVSLAAFRLYGARLMPPPEQPLGL